LEDFSKVCKDFRVGLKNRDTTLLFEMFDPNKEGQCNYKEFVS